MAFPRRIPKKTAQNGLGDPKHVGGSAFPDGKPVCKPTAPWRNPKPVGGPVHPGFPKPGSVYAEKAKAPQKKVDFPIVGPPQVAEQNYDLYKSTRKSVVVPKKRNKPK